MLRFVEVAMGEGGAVSCSRCAAPVAPSYRPAADIVAEVTAAAPADISLAGPEPFNHPDLPDIVAAAVRAGVARLRVETAGAALAHGDNAAGAQVAGVLHARVALLGPEGVHDAVAGAPGLFAAAEAGMRAWSATAEASGERTFLSGLIPVCEHNAPHLPATVAEFARLGAREVVLRLVPGADVERAASWIAAACDTGTVNRVWVRVEGADEALLPGLELHLTPELPREMAGA